MNGTYSLLLAVFSAFTMNLTLQCAIGLKKASESENYKAITTLYKLSLIFIIVILLWFSFSKILYSLFSGIFIYVLLFPVSYIVYEGLEYLLFRYLLKNEKKDESFVSFPGGITAVAVFLCLNISGNFLETAMLSFGFTFGIFLVLMIIREVRKRASLEEVPLFLRGNPLILITMGLLSLVFSVGSLLILRMINAG